MPVVSERGQISRHISGLIYILGPHFPQPHCKFGPIRSGAFLQLVMYMNVMKIRHAPLFLALLAPAHGDECDWIDNTTQEDSSPSANTNQEDSSNRRHYEGSHGAEGGGRLGQRLQTAGNRATIWRSMGHGEDWGARSARLSRRTWCSSDFQCGGCCTLPCVGCAPELYKLEGRGWRAAAPCGARAFGKDRHFEGSLRGVPTFPPSEVVCAKT